MLCVVFSALLAVMEAGTGGSIDAGICTPVASVW
jgi:hypothetical protein